MNVTIKKYRKQKKKKKYIYIYIYIYYLIYGTYEAVRKYKHHQNIHIDKAFIHHPK